MGRSIGGEFRRKHRVELVADNSRGLTGAQRDVLRNDAARVQFSRQLRRKLFGSEMFAETAWDILLTLYLADGQPPRWGAAELAHLSDSPLSTTLRWLTYLDQAGLVSRIAGKGRDPFAGVELSDKGRRLLDTYFLELRQTQVFGSPDSAVGTGP